MAEKRLTPKTVFLVCGNKGGVGKSLFCLALGSALNGDGLSFAVIDGDGRTGDVHASFRKTNPSRWADFRGLRPAMSSLYDGPEYQASITELFKYSDNIIINTPDGADSVLAKWFYRTKDITECGGYRLNMIYLMSDRSDGLDSLNNFVANFQYVYPVRNLYFGSVIKFMTFNTVHAHRFHQILDFPVMRDIELSMLFDLHSFPGSALEKNKKGLYDFPVLSRCRLKDWQERFEDVIFDLLNSDSSNIKPITETSDTE